MMRGSFCDAFWIRANSPMMIGGRIGGKEQFEEEKELPYPRTLKCYPCMYEYSINKEDKVICPKCGSETIS